MSNNPKPLKELLIEAVQAFKTSENPDLSELKERLNPHLRARGFDRASEPIVRVSQHEENGGYFEIHSFWSSKGFQQHVRYVLSLEEVELCKLTS